MPTTNPNTGRRIQAAYDLGHDSYSAGQRVNPYSAKRPNLRASWQEGYDDASAGPLCKIEPDTDLDTVCKPGDRVRVWLLPIHAYTLNAAGDDSIPSLAGRELAAILAGTFDATICDTECKYFDQSTTDASAVPGLELREISLPEYARAGTALNTADLGADSLGLLAGQITHLQVIKASPLPECAKFGGLDLEWTRKGKLLANGFAVSPQLAAGVWAMRGRERVGAALKYTQAELIHDWNAAPTISLSPGGFAAGCARATLAELDQALDWAAVKLGWV
jgi:hypothetical protein